MRDVPARAACGGITVIEHELKAVRYLRREVPEDWDRAADAAGHGDGVLRSLRYPRDAAALQADGD